MPAPIDADVRAAILADIRAGTKARNQIARDHAVSTTTVSKIARDEGVTDAFSREQTENGTRARVADMAALRAQLASDLLDDAQRLRQRAWSKYQIVTASDDGPRITTLDLPPLDQVRNAYVAMGIAFDKHRHAIEFDQDKDTTSAAKSMLGQLSEALGVAANSMGETPPAGP